jgi:kynurenine formamidase
MYIDLTLKFDRNDAIFDDMKRDPRELFQSGHFGTHIDVHLKTSVPLEYMRSSGILMDVSHVTDRDIELSDFECNNIQEKDFVIFKTNMITRHAYGSKAYFLQHPQLSQAILDFLVAKKVALIGIDAAGVRRGGEHIVADKFCEAAGIYIVENLMNLDMLSQKKPGRFSLTTAWIEIPGQTGLPCRVVAH